MSAIDSLLAELRHADHIIKVMLNAMTAQQKAKVGAQLEADGVAGEGITRHHERAAAIEAATKAEPVGTNQVPGRAQLLGIEAHANDIDEQARNIEILLDALFLKVDDLNSPDSPAVAAINCFATCALRNAVLTREASDQILELIEAGMAA